MPGPWESPPREASRNSHQHTGKNSQKWDGRGYAGWSSNGEIFHPLHSRCSWWASHLHEIIFVWSFSGVPIFWGWNQYSSACQLFVDKDTIVNAVNASHDAHLLKIDNREDDIVTKANSWASVLIEKVSLTPLCAFLKWTLTILKVKIPRLQSKPPVKPA